MDDIPALEDRYQAALKGRPDRRLTACDLAARLMAQFMAQAGPVEDRDRAIDLFEEALSGPGLSPEAALAAHMGAGALLMLRALPAPIHGDPQGIGLMAFVDFMAGRRTDDPARQADVRRAIRHLQTVVDEAQADSPMRLKALAPLAVLRLLPESGSVHTAPAMRVMDEAVATSAPEERVLAAGLRAVIRSGDAEGLTAQEAAEVRSDLEQVLEVMPAHPRLRARLLSELSTTLGRMGQATGLPSLLLAAPAVAERALESMADDDPDREDGLRRLAGLLLSATAFHAEAEGVDRLVDLAERLVAAAAASGDGVREGKDRFLRAMVLTLRARQDNSLADLHTATEDLESALAAIPSEDPIVPVVVAMFGALVGDRGLSHGGMADTGAGRQLLSRALEADKAGAGSDVHLFRSIESLAHAVKAMRERDFDELDSAIDGLRTAIAGLPPGYPWRSRFDAVLGLALVTRGRSAGDAAAIRSGLDEMHRAAGDLAIEESGRPMMLAAGAIATLLGGLFEGDREAVLAATDELDQIGGFDKFTVDERVAMLCLLATAHLIRHANGAVGELDRAIERYEEAREGLVGRGAHPLSAQLLRDLAMAYRQRWERDAKADQNRSVETGLAGLRARGRDVLLQSGTGHGLTAIREAPEDAARIARWCLADGDLIRMLEAVELGRGLVLHAATSVAELLQLLRENGRDDLAAEWAAQETRRPQGAAEPELDRFAGAFLGEEVPSDLRLRVLDALNGTAAAQRLESVPDPAEIARTLAGIGATAMAYLLPGDERDDGLILVVATTGNLSVLKAPGLATAPDTYATADGAREIEAYPADGGRTSLEQVCDWAWSAAIGPLMSHLGLDANATAAPERIVVVPVGVLGAVPWHAARWFDGVRHRYACESLLFTYAASARQLIDAAYRELLPRHNVVLVADRSSKLTGALAETHALAEDIYPGALALTAADPEAVLAHLPGAAAAGVGLLHFACHGYAGTSADRSYLRLSDAIDPMAHSRLTLARILDQARGRPAGASGGLVVLAACVTDRTVAAHDEVLTLATAFLAAGAVGVVGSRWAVNDSVTAHLMYMFHHYLTVEALPADRALRAAQLWMLDPDRVSPAGLRRLPPVDVDLLPAVESWAAFSYHGR